MRIADRLFTRLLVTFLLAFVPFALILTWALTEKARDGITMAVSRNVSTTAASLAARIDFYLQNRVKDVEQLAADLADDLDDPGDLGPQLRALDRVREAYDVVALLTPEGAPLASSQPRRSPAAAGTDWLAATASGRSVLGTMRRADGGLVLVAAAPVGTGSRPRAVVAADLDVTQVAAFAAEMAPRGSGETLLVDADLREIADTADGSPGSEARMLDGGALRERVDTSAARMATAGRRGATQSETGGEHISGYAPVPLAGWGVIVREDRELALAAVEDQRALAGVLLLLGAAVAAALAFVFARQASRPIDRLAGAARSVASGDLATRVEADGTAEVRELSGSFNEMVGSLASLVGRMGDTSSDLSSAAGDLAAAAEQLAATTRQQTAAAGATSATMEDLARTFASIAGTVASVADQTAETRRALEQAESDLSATSERTLGMSRRVEEISGLLELIDDIAERTNLLALNAAIEAARAGEDGRGFTVVADEVRRLAESSKSRADEIAEIVESAQAETEATVSSMRRSAEGMRRGLELMDEVTEAAAQVRLTTNQQTAAAAQVVQTMEDVTETSRQTAATAHQIAAAAHQLTGLVDRLRRAAERVESPDARR